MSFDLQPVELCRQSLADASQSLNAQLSEMEGLENELFPPSSFLSSSSHKFVMGRGLAGKIHILFLLEKGRIRKKTIAPLWLWYLWWRVPKKFALWQVLSKAGRALKDLPGKDTALK
jgi:hypothetical protein